MMFPVNFRPVGDLNGFFRSGDPTTISTEAAKKLKAVSGIGSFVDLRSESEVRKSGPPMGLLAGGIQWIQSPIQSYSRSAIEKPYPSEDDYCRLYLDILNEAGGELVGAILCIVDQMPSPVSFGCHAGKDRTGLVAALLLELAGRSVSEVSVDYAAGGFLLRKSLKHFAPKWRARGTSGAEYLHRLSTPRSTMEKLYALLDGQCLLNHMRTRGLHPALAMNLSSRMEVQ